MLHAMKIKPEHLEHMRAALAPVLPTLPSLAEYGAQGIGKDHAKRRRWDAFKAAGLTGFACDTLYAYANDEHIDTALRALVPENPDPAQMTMAEHAEAWTRESGLPVPSRDTAEWQAMYERWVAFAFADFGPNHKGATPA